MKSSESGRLQNKNILKTKQETRYHPARKTNFNPPQNPLKNIHMTIY